MVAMRRNGLLGLIVKMILNRQNGHLTLDICEISDDVMGIIPPSSFDERAQGQSLRSLALAISGGLDWNE